jgi:hypothetical protein
MKITSRTITRREANLDEHEFAEFRTTPRTTMVVTRATLEIGPDHWRFTVFGHRKENRTPGYVSDRSMEDSSVSGASLPAELSGLLQQMRNAVT